MTWLKRLMYFTVGVFIAFVCAGLYLMSELQR